MQLREYNHMHVHARSWIKKRKDMRLIKNLFTKLKSRNISILIYIIKKSRRTKLSQTSDFVQLLFVSSLANNRIKEILTQLYEMYKYIAF